MQVRISILKHICHRIIPSQTTPTSSLEFCAPLRRVEIGLQESPQAWTTKPEHCLLKAAPESCLVKKYELTGLTMTMRHAVTGAKFS